MSFRVDVKGGDIEKEMGDLVDILTKNKIGNIYEVTKGFIPYQLGSELNTNLNVNIKDSKVKEMLIVKHYERELKRGKKNPENIQTLLNSPNLSEVEKGMLNTFLSKSFYNTDIQDLIFIPQTEIMVIFPSKDEDNILKYILNPYFEDVFEFNFDPIVRKITQDVLEWLVWKVKKYDGGFVGQSLQIEEIDTYDSAARLDTGELKVTINGIEDNLHAMLAMAFNEKCKGVKLSVSYESDSFCFSLFPEGGYVPFWSNVPKYDENNHINKILVL